MSKKPRRVREQSVVYMSATDRELLERLAEETGLPRTELFRRGLRKLAEELLPELGPGSSVDYLTEIAGDTDAPSDLSARHDDYLFGPGAGGVHRAPSDDEA
ncbi:MAG: hypothetical protein R3253_11310 [Longimicrobiales bacterium]|nr:hypothetical protein [Longimicrobiales bacterium]